MNEMHLWSKDHWSLLAYAASCFDGELDGRCLRCNRNTHPLLDRNGFEWQNSYGTRLSDGSRLTTHDDYDVLEDLEEAGLVEVISLMNGFVRLTKAGSDLAFELRGHRQAGGNFADFKPSPSTAALKERPQAVRL